MDIATLFSFIGTLGAAFLVASYIPQIRHLHKVKDSTGMSVSFWAILSLGIFFLLVNLVFVSWVGGPAVFVKALINIAAQVINLVLALVSLVMVLKYKKK